jgi:tetratricopeptide (TPR) repeat protein
MASATEEEIAKLRSLLQVARQQYQEGLFDKAEPVFKRALFFFTEGAELRQSLECLTNIYAIQRNYAEALESAIGLLALNEKEFGKNDKRTIAVLKEIADIYTEAGQPQKAEGMQKKAHAREKAAERGEIDPTDTSSTYKTLDTEPAEEPEEKQPLSPREKVQSYLDQLRPIISAITLDLSDYRTSFYAKLIATVIVILLLIAIAGFLPRSQSALDVYSSIPHNYETADHNASFKLIDSSNCVFQRNLEKGSGNNSEPEDPNVPKKMEMAYSQYLPDWRDAWAMTFGNIYEKEYWVQRRDDAILDEDGRTYYGHEGKEYKILDQMTDIRNAVDAFIKKTGKYPDHLTKEMVRPLSNPFTGQAELPTCQTVEVGNNKCTTQYSLEERANFYRSLTDGGSWKGEPPLHPGAINTCYVLARSEAGEFYDFIVRGCDRHGKTLQTSEPGKSYILSVSGAKEFSLPVPAVPFSGKLLVRPRRVWLIAPEIGSLSLYFARHGLSYLWGALALGFLVYCLRKKLILEEWEDSDYKFISYIAGCAVMIIIYEFSLGCP